MIEKAANRAGIRTPVEDGLDKAAQRLTTLDDVLRGASRVDETDGTVDKPAPAESTAAPAGDLRQPDPTLRERVLVVEDSLTTASVVKYFLELEGFEVLLAEDGLIGLEVALRERPDVIVTDVKMPGMDGVEMVKALRADARTSRIRVLMLTSESSIAGVKEGLAAGADDYVLKPVYPRLLAARVKALRARPRPEA